MGRPKRDAMIRFREKVIVQDNGCWDWQSCLDRVGYGRFWYEGAQISAHRFIYERLFGAIPNGLEFDHLCRNVRCVNPFHLEPVTHRENVRRGLTPEISRQRQLNKTHCPHGHPYNKVNTMLTKEGFRNCRICCKLSKIKYRLRNGARIKPKNIIFLQEYLPITIDDAIKKCQEGWVDGG